ncbi:NAD(P)-binding domain-containing protein [Listeria weihenstephanensis]|uniref:NAD(P)-binding domain-containing protein n=1 Tax=Listeria weihenstephanensis TaxID=1006155 RepID=A0A841ZB17_9LIST|nr:2-dehydropantoate 2-reductase N-terminal domain-containing protein [Listeria weihenstephanensis]MBC1501792.1 NAD(P)-binding domain-containing protein [Listeria weihenstephanensis]
MTDQQTRLLIFGAGVIGSTYAQSFVAAGYEVTLLARGKRLQELRENGLMYNEKGVTKRAHVEVIEKLEVDDIYDFIFVPVRYEQAESALLGLKDNQSETIVTLINNPSGYEKWSQILGGKRLLPAFPSAGGEIKNGILYSQYGPKMIQKTIFGEIDGQISERVKRLAGIFKEAKIGAEVVREMDAMQKTHVALVAALTKDIYLQTRLKTPAEVTDKESIRKMAWTIKNYLKALERSGVKITPSKLKILALMPVGLLSFTLKWIFSAKMTREVLFSDHAMNFKAEVELMNADLLAFYAENDILEAHWDTKLI